MKNTFTKMSTQKKLGLLALVLGFFAIFAGSPYDTGKITLNVKDLALIAQKDSDNISVQSVADWIIKGNLNYQIIDTRSPQEYADYHIPMARNIQISDLLDQNFYPTDKIILYSDSNEKAALGWFLLKAKKYNAVYILKGGLDEWKNQILFPKLPANATTEQLASFEKVKEVSKFFGGTPQTGTSTGETEPTIKSLPKLKLPAALPSEGPKKKRKEGC